MNQELKIKAPLLDIESKLDKNNSPYFRLSLLGIPGRYYYAFSYYLSSEIWQTLTNTPHHLVNRQVLITYEELPNKDNLRTFYKVKAIEIK